MNKSDFATLTPINVALLEAIDTLEAIRGTMHRFYPDCSDMPTEDDLEEMAETLEDFRKLVPQVVSKVESFIGGAW